MLTRARLRERGQGIIQDLVEGICQHGIQRGACSCGAAYVRAAARGRNVPSQCGAVCEPRSAQLTQRRRRGKQADIGSKSFGNVQVHDHSAVPTCINFQAANGDHSTQRVPVCTDELWLRTQQTEGAVTGPCFSEPLGWDVGQPSHMDTTRSVWKKWDLAAAREIWRSFEPSGSSGSDVELWDVQLWGKAACPLSFTDAATLDVANAECSMECSLEPPAEAGPMYVNISGLEGVVFA